MPRWFKNKKRGFLPVIIALFAVLFLPQSAFAATLEITEKEDWDTGSLTDIVETTTDFGIELADDGTIGALNWETPQKSISAGSAFTSDGTNMYVSRGVGDTIFWKFSTVTGEWSELTPLPHGTYYGSDLQYLDGYIYALFGGYQDEFYRYSVANDSWERLEDYQELTYYGASLTTDGTDIYSIAANNTQGFYKYDVSEGTWGTLAGTPATFRQGADLNYYNGKIYSPRGANTTSFYEYDIATNAWTQLANIPGTMYDDVDTTVHDGAIYVARQYNSTSFYKYDIASNTWTTLAEAPATARYAGVIYMEHDDYIYFFRGYGDYRVWKYDIDNNEFIGPKDAPGTLNTGSDMVYVDGYIYTTRGVNQVVLYRYNVSTNEWETMAPCPTTFYDDTRGVAVGTDIYWFRGYNTLTSYRYSTTANTWTQLSDAPATVRYGAQFAYPGSGDYLYATRGNNTNSFWRYSISTDTWDDTISDLPSGIRSGYGSTLFSDGTDIYFSSGTGTSKMFKYDITGNTWTQLSNMPFGAHYGTDSTYYDGKAIFLAGNYRTEMWEYTLATDSWRRLQDFVGYRQLRQGAYSGASIEYGGNGTYYLSRGANLVEIMAYTPGTGSYVNNGTWESQTYDLKYVDSWNNISVSSNTPSDSYITVQTRTSTDAINWSTWENISGTDIASPTNRFLQIRTLLFASTDTTQTPSITDITIDYVQDTNPPTQPENITGKSQEVGGEDIVDGQSYNYANPHFSWDPSTDAETNITGYYIYFGPDAGADPVANGTFQTSTSYTALNSMSVGSNYLRIVAEDELQNRSTPLAAFEYVYDGVGPVISLEVNNANLLGTTTSTQVTSQGVKLASNSGGFWLQERIPLSPANLGYGTKGIGYVESSNKFYVPRGMNADFYEYDIDTSTWTTLTAAPNTIYYGGGAVEGPDGYIYVVRGYNSTDFWRYDINNNLWETEISSAPLTVGYGGSSLFDGTQYIYMLRGNNSDVFWRYDTFEDAWENLSDVEFGAPSDAINNNVYVGGNLTFDRENGLIYAIQGGYRSGFSMYNIDEDSWTVLSNVPELPYHGSDIEITEDNQTIYYIPGNYSTSLYKYDIASQEWTKMQSSPLGFYYGAGLHRVEDNFYAVRGGNSRYMYKYDINKDSWLKPQRGLFGIEYDGSSILNTYYGADITKGDGDNYYITRGNYSDYFVRWNETTGEITDLGHLPTGIYYGSSLEYESTNNKIYFTGGIYNQSFFVYDIETGVWTELVDDPTPYAASYGSSMAYDGSRYIYWSRGGNSSALYRYDTQDLAGSRWSTISNSPAGLGYGSELTYKDGYIYTMRGQNANPNLMYRYNTSDDTWITMPSNYGEQIYNSGWMVDGGDDNFYVARGGNTDVFKKYNLTSETWTTAPTIPGQFYAGSAGAGNGVNSIYAISGNGTSTSQDALYTYILETDDSSFENEGEYESQTHDLTRVYKWANLTIEYDTPNNTNLVIKTATSEDGIEWSNWSPVNRMKEYDTNYTYKINSQPNRYIKLKFTISSGDGVLSPTINNYTINYYQDLDSPSNPTSLTSLGTTDPEVSITTDSWYNYDTPQFSWPEVGQPGAADDGANGSGVAGYYVYWGTDSEADPETEGTLQTELTYTPQSLEDATTYYLRIKTVDEANNTSAETWQPFIYKYDSSGPEAPENLTSDPAGFTAIDDFSFTWDAVTTEGAQVTEYCYITGEEGATEQCISSTSINSITSYKVGANIFEVRAKDEAGNYSQKAMVNYFYVDAAHAPAPPLNLQVQPESNTENSFGFIWDPPAEGTYFGSQSNLAYMYSVNALPTEFSVSETSLRYLNPGAYATLPGENILYMVTRDEAGNVDYTNYTQVSFYANTIAPGIPVNMEIADVSVKSTQSWRLAISWDEPEDPGSGVAGYQIYRSVDGENFNFHTYTSAASLVDSKLIQVTYYYKVRACDSTNNCGAFSETVSFYPDGRYTEPAELIVDPIVSDITPKRATISWVTARTADSRIAFGLESGEYFEEEVSNSDHMVDHALTVNNLTPGTTYYYVTKWTDEDGNTGVSEEATFETSPPPSIEEPIVKSVGLNSALIEFTTRDTSKVRIYYGETSSFGGMVEVYTGTSEGTHTVELKDIKDGTKYFYKINTFDIDSSEYEGETHSFETLPRPEVSDVKIYQVSGTSQTTLLIEWDSNTPVSSIITYYPSASPDKALDEVNVALKNGKHRMILTYLEANTQYSIIVHGRDFIGNEATSGVKYFTTAADTRPPQIFDLEVSTEIVGSGQEATAQLVVSYKTDELATSQVEYGEGTGTTYAQKTQEDSNMSQHHIVVVSGLTPSKVYHLRAISKDDNDNIGYSVDKVVVTSNATEDALDLAISNLTSIFSFLGN